MSDLEDMSRFAQEGHIEIHPDAMEKLFRDGPIITVSGTFNDAIAEPSELCDCEDGESLRQYTTMQAQYWYWARAHRN